MSSIWQTAIKTWHLSFNFTRSVLMAPFTACFVIHNPVFKKNYNVIFQSFYLEHRVELAAGLQENIFKSLQINMKIRTIFYFCCSLWFSCWFQSFQGDQERKGRYPWEIELDRRERRLSENFSTSFLKGFPISSTWNVRQGDRCDSQ